MSDKTGEAKASATVSHDGRALLSGPLTLESVGALYAGLDPGTVNEVDLAAVGRVDSAGLALLLEWQARAGRPFRTVNAPSGLYRLAVLSEAVDLLQMSKPDDARG